MFGGISIIQNSDGDAVQIKLQEKTVSPEETINTVTADSGYTGLSKVTVNAIPNTYIGSNITRLAATTYTPNTSDRTIASGTYLTGTQTIKGDSNLKSENIKSGVSIFGVSGTFVGNSSSGSGGINPTYTQTEKTWIPGTTNQTIPAGTYCEGIQTIAGDVDLIDSNIKSGVTIFDVTGTYTGPEGNVVPTTTLETTTWTPTTSAQTIAAGTYCEGTQTIAAIPSDYVKPSAQKGATTYIPNTSDQTIASNTYLTGTQTIKGDTNLVASNIKSGTTIFNVTGTYSGPSGSVTPTATQAAKTWTPSTSNQTIAAGTYCSGAQTIAGDADLIASNIKSGVTIFNVTGTYAGSSGATVYTAETTPSSNSTTINFTVSKQPTIFSVMALENIASATTRKIVNIDYDGSTIKSQTAYSTSNYSAGTIYYYDSAISQSYSNGTLTLTSSSTSTGGYFANGITYRLLYITDEVSSGGTSINLQSNKTVTPTSFPTTVTPDSGYDGMSKVTINQPTGYVKPSGTLSITTNGTHTVTNYASVNVNVSSSSSGPGIDTILQTASGIDLSIGGWNSSSSITYSSNEPVPTLNTAGTSITLSFSGTTSSLNNISASSDFSVLKNKYISTNSSTFYFIPTSATFTYTESTSAWGGSDTLSISSAQQVIMSLS